MNRKTLFMNRADYLRYLRSPEWKEKAERKREDSNHICEICENQIIIAIEAMAHPRVYEYYSQIKNLVRFIDTFEEWKGRSRNFIVVHHKTYEHLGVESENDIAAICIACHVVITENTPRYGLDKAWEITYDYMEVIIEQIKIAKKTLLDEIKLDEELEQWMNTNSSFSWLIPPKR